MFQVPSVRSNSGAGHGEGCSVVRIQKGVLQLVHGAHTYFNDRFARAIILDYFFSNQPTRLGSEALPKSCANSVSSSSFLPFFSGHAQALTSVEGERPSAGRNQRLAVVLLLLISPSQACPVSDATALKMTCTRCVVKSSGPRG